MKKYKRLLLSFWIMGLLGMMGCSSQYGEVSLNKIQINVYERIYRGRPNYLIFPAHIAPFHVKAALFPFRIKKEITPRRYPSLELTRVLFANWEKHRVFLRILLFSTRPHTLRKAAEIALKAGCNVMIMPEITYCLFGGQSGTTILALKIDIYSCSDLHLIWSVTHIGRLEHGSREDYVFFTVDKRVPFSPEAVIVDRLASDIFPPIKRWAWQDYPIFPSEKKTLF